MTRVKNKKTKFRFTYQFGLLILFLISILVISIWVSQPSESQRIRDYFNNAIPEDHIVSKINQNQFLSRKAATNEDEFMIVFFGTSEDASLLNQLHAVLGQRSDQGLALISDGYINTIFYLNAQFAVDLINEQEDEDNDVDNTDALEKHSERLGFDVEHVPTVMLIMGGEIIVSTSDEVFEDEIEANQWGSVFLLMATRIQEVIISSN